eukprot:1484715-Amphidinium_carterae.1
MGGPPGLAIRGLKRATSVGSRSRLDALGRVYLVLPVLPAFASLDQVLGVLIWHILWLHTGLICFYPPRDLADHPGTTEHTLFSIVSGLRMGGHTGLALQGLKRTIS